MGSYENVMLPESFDDLDVGITLRNPNTGELIDMNGQVEELYGYSRPDLLEMSLGDYTAPSTKFSEEEAIRRIRLAASGDSQVFEWRIERGNGELIWVQVRLNQTTISGTLCVLAEIRDITGYKAREQRLRLLNRVVRHNLRNETNILMGYADRLKGAVEKETLEQEAETILEIATEIGTLSDSVRQIEEIAEPDATQRTSLNIGELVETTVSEIRSEYPIAELTIETQADIWVKADKGLKYAIEHAVDNAIVHNDQEIPIVGVFATVNENTNQAEVKIIDNGPTIPQMEIDVLNDQEEASNTYHGSGLGLWVMQWCVGSLGGELIFEENSPRGNVVRILLPQADPKGSS
ncbi:PAS domain-containing sensor histidine kinase [Natrinema salinisoli]|uniref:PAS domain-containing sensor histidine kinase n=1 Tax=Natrinema salinisoli TaxID=2878535 RepID=UPI001CEFD9CB|nr:PAS domain-containing sensor histidine kinase [Natrinema salinisoli]